MRLSVRRRTTLLAVADDRQRWLPMSLRPPPQKHPQDRRPRPRGGPLESPSVGYRLGSSNCMHRIIGTPEPHRRSARRRRPPADRARRIARRARHLQRRRCSATPRRRSAPADPVRRVPPAGSRGCRQEPNGSSRSSSDAGDPRQRSPSTVRVVPRHRPARPSSTAATPPPRRSGFEPCPDHAAARPAGPAASSSPSCGGSPSTIRTPGQATGPRGPARQAPAVCPSSNVAPLLVAEVAPAREDHRDAGRVAGLDHLAVALASRRAGSRPSRRRRSPPAARRRTGRTRRRRRRMPASSSLGLLAAGVVRLLDGDPDASRPGSSARRRSRSSPGPWRARSRWSARAGRPSRRRSGRATAPRSARPSSRPPSTRARRVRGRPPGPARRRAPA